MDAIRTRLTLASLRQPGMPSAATTPADAPPCPGSGGETAIISAAALKGAPAADEIASLARPATAAVAQSSVQEFCDAAWPILAVKGTDGKIFGEQAEARRCVLGEPRLNRPYPDPDLARAGIPQDFPLTVATPFKWLLSPPQPIGDHVLLHAQHEGGPGFCDNEELECRDLFIALKRDPATGRFVETGHLMTRNPEYGYVYRSVDPVQRVPGSERQFIAHIEEGTYSTGIFARHTHLYQIDDDAIREVGRWDGHLAPDALPQPQP